jgi:hypothetical protein
VHKPDQDVVCKRKNKLYVADWCIEDTVASATVCENEQLYEPRSKYVGQRKHMNF